MRLLLLLAALLLTSDSFAGAQPRARHIEQVPIRGSATIPVHVYGPERAKSVVVVYPGGGGELVRQLEANGFPAHLVPPLVRAGYAVMLVDLPSDIVALWGKRLSPGHRDELRAVLRYARRAGHERVWVLGHSKGSVSAAATALLPAGEAPAGVILASSVFRSDGEDLWSVPMREVTGPVLFVHNRADSCPDTPYAGLEEILKSAVKARVEVRTFDHRPWFGMRCPPGSAHAFAGIEDDVAAEIVAWIHANGG